jgi:hypothetical protein
MHGGDAGLRKTISQKKIAATHCRGLIVEGLHFGAIAECPPRTKGFAPKPLNDQTTCNGKNRDRLEETGIAEWILSSFEKGQLNHHVNPQAGGI